MGQMQAARARCGALARRAGVLSLLALLAVAAGGGAPGYAQEDRGYATQAYTPKDFRLPDGEGCAGEVARWRAVQDNDFRSGNIGLKVYHQIQGEIGRAEAACTAGRDGEARTLVRESKRRHGYPG